MWPNARQKARLWQDRQPDSCDISTEKLSAFVSRTNRFPQCIVRALVAAASAPISRSQSESKLPVDSPNRRNANRHSFGIYRRSQTMSVATRDPSIPATSKLGSQFCQRKTLSSCLSQVTPRAKLFPGPSSAPFAAGCFNLV